MEGTLLGIPSVALSQNFQHRHPVKWATAEHHGPKVLRQLLKAGWPKDVLINVNFPDTIAPQIEGVEVASQGKRDMSDLLIDSRIDARGVPYYWIGFRRQVGKPISGTDLRAIADNKISVTPLQLDLTHRQSLAKLRQAFA